jgi:hypothetical protein
MAKADRDVLQSWAGGQAANRAMHEFPRFVSELLEG